MNIQNEFQQDKHSTYEVAACLFTCRLAFSFARLFFYVCFLAVFASSLSSPLLPNIFQIKGPTNGMYIPTRFWYLLYKGYFFNVICSVNFPEE
mmetsp:Transcript_3309/g.4495  ORF Transcript_3309/g.4495 Transcript_3309/m.4495 type:complete len:93 (-) Transcript_3309:1013-1291(-)